MPGGRIADFTAAKHKPQLLRPKPCAIGQNLYNLHPYADVAKLVDAPDLGSYAERCESSSLSVRTKIFISFIMLYTTWCKCGANHITGRFSFWRSSHPSTSSFSTKNVSSIRIFARGNPDAVRTALKMYAFLRIKYLRIAAGLGIRYPFKTSKLNYIYAACFFRFRRASASGAGSDSLMART